MYIRTHLNSTFARDYDNELIVRRHCKNREEIFKFTFIQSVARLEDSKNCNLLRVNS